MKKIIVAIAAVIVIISVFFIGYSIGKNHVIYSQEIYTNKDGYSIVIDGQEHLYN